MYKQLEKMEQAVSRYKDKRDRGEEGYSFDVHEFMKATLIAVRRMNRAVLDLQLKQWGFVQRKAILDTLDDLNMEDLLIVQSKTNKILLKRIRGEI